NVITEVTTEMPRSRSIFIQSDRVFRRSPLALTCPARLMAPPTSSSFSVSVVLPASGWEMIANVRRRATSSVSGERDGDSVVAAMSDMRLERLAGKTGLIKPHLVVAQRIGQPHIGNGEGRPSSFTAHPRGRPCLVRRVVMAWIILFVARLMEICSGIRRQHTPRFTAA